jgi:tetratricopeptide (TPR) repeat protein
MEALGFPPMMPGPLRDDGNDPVIEALRLLEAGEALPAAKILETLLGEGRDGPRLRLALGRVRLALGDIAGALESVREACLLAPDSAEAALAHGEALLKAQALPGAIAELQRALRLAPEWESTRFALGAAWAEAGEDARARDYLVPLAQESSAPPALAAKAGEMLAALDGRAHRPRAAPNYVRHLFDQFAEDYDAHMLGTLSYQAPAVLRELADLVMGAPLPHSLAILDLGCGTGLAGERFRDLAASWTGSIFLPRCWRRRGRAGFTTPSMKPIWKPR